MAAELETQGRQEDLTEVEALWQRLTREVGRLSDTLRQSAARPPIS